MTNEDIRPARPADVPAVKAVTDAGRRLLAFVDAHARALGLPEVRLYTNALMWENQQIYPKYGYEVVERRVEGPYDRVHYRKRLD